MADKCYAGKDVEASLTETVKTLLRPAKTNEPPRDGAKFLGPLRLRIESVFDTLKGQLSLERHGGTHHKE